MDPYRLVNLVCNRLLNNPIDRTVHPIIKSSPQVKDFNIRDYELLHFQNTTLTISNSFIRIS